MHGSTVFLIAFFTSILTAFGSVYAIERFDLIPPKPAAVAESVVPDLRGFSEADARANAQASQITLMVQSREPSSEVKPGSILRQSVPAGQRVPRQHPISVVVAEELPKVPAVTGLVLAEATKRLEEKGYKIQAGEPVPNPKVPEGQIFTQNPLADAPAEKGRVVIVQVSAGTGEVEVPKVMGLSVNNAKAALEKVGLEAEVRWVSLAEVPTFVVLSQKPKPKEKAPAGSKVEISANQ